MPSLTTLPPELLQLVLSTLKNSDLKNLRLACTTLLAIAQLRLERVFLSAHPRDIQVLNEVASHPTYSKHVTELIYDDSWFPKSRLNEAEQEYDDHLHEIDEPPRSEAPRWYEEAYDEHCENLEENYKNSFVQTSEDIRIAKEYESRLDLSQSYNRYLKILEEQDRVIVEGSDIKALEHALEHFPNLQRVTLTHVAHGSIPLRPLYETPMIRELPYGLIYPMPRSWPFRDNHQGEAYVPLPWDDEQVENTEAKSRWRGFSLVVDTLAKQPHHRIVEFVAEVNSLPTGLPCRIFDHRGHKSDYPPEYRNLVSLLERPNFSRLDLALDVGDQDHDEWPFYRSGLLRDALSKAADLRHFSLSTGTMALLSPEEGQFFPLSTLLPSPAEEWKHLCHFGLSGFVVRRLDLVNFLLTMPSTLRSVELSFLLFKDLDKSDWREFLYDVRDKLDWNQRPVLERPSIKVYVESDTSGDHSCVDISGEVEEFVYRQEINPFDMYEGSKGSQIFRNSIIGVERNLFNPDKDRPFLGGQHLMELGLRKPPDGRWRHYQFDDPLTPEERAKYKDFEVAEKREAYLNTLDDNIIRVHHQKRGPTGVE